MKKYWNGIHRKLFRRMHDLDYLQWMQRNSARYVAGAAILILLVMTAVDLKPALKNLINREEYQSAFQDTTVQGDTAMKQAEVMVTQDELLGRTNKTDNIGNTTEENGTADDIDDIIEKREEKNATVSEPDFINPTKAAGYTLPINGKVQYDYGIGYDAEYDDYRFHTDVCYTAGDGNVMACLGGTVIDVQMQDQWQISVKCAEGIVQYAGLRQCKIQSGDVITAGAQIGTVQDTLHIRMFSYE